MEEDTIYSIEQFNILGPENDEGNIEYKYKLTNLDDERLNKRTTQLKYRINEGCGEAFYYIGIMDDGTIIGLPKNEYIESVNNLNLIAHNLECKVIVINETILNNIYVGYFIVRELENNNYVDLKIGVAGNVDAGKSTTVGTLTRDILDDGKGKSRVYAFNHKHEILSGRTSSIGHQIMGFDSSGNVIGSKLDRQMSWVDIVNRSNKIITFYDLAGHEKYLHTTILGLTSIYPDYCLIMIGANMGINHMTREHISLCLNLKIPFIIVVSKIDIVPEHILVNTMSKINLMCKNGIKKIPYQIKNISDIISVVKNIKSDSIIPIIQISNVTNYNLDLLKSLLNLLPVRNDYTEFIHKPVELIIDNKYSVNGHPVIISGVLRSGIIKVNDTLAIGPFSDNSYRQVKVKSIHCKFKDIKEARAGSYICISLRNINRKEIRKGMILVQNNDECKLAVREFWAFVNILHSPTTITTRYQPFVHIDQIRQVVKIKEIHKIINKNVPKPIPEPIPETSLEPITNTNTNSNQDIKQMSLITGDIAHVKLEFLLRPEYIKPHMKLIFREGKVKAFGKIIEKPKYIE
jgi:GTPase